MVIGIYNEILPRGFIKFLDLARKFLLLNFRKSYPNQFNRLLSDEMSQILFQLLAVGLEFIALRLFLLVFLAFPLGFPDCFAGNALSLLLNKLLLILTKLFSRLTFGFGGFSVLVGGQCVVSKP